MSEATERQILYVCKSRGCSNVAHEEKIMFPKKDWQRMYDKIRRNTAVEWAGYSVLGLRKIDRKAQLLIQADLECDKCRSPIHELPNKNWKSSGIEFREYNNKDTGHTYRCARCGKPVKSWLIVRGQLIFGYRCARKLAREIKQGVNEADLWAQIEEAQEARRAHEGEPAPKSMPSPDQMIKDVCEEAGVEDSREKEPTPVPPPEVMIDHVKKEMAKKKPKPMIDRFSKTGKKDVK